MDAMPEENVLKLSIRGIDYTGYASNCSRASTQWAKVNTRARSNILR